MGRSRSAGAAGKRREVGLSSSGGGLSLGCTLELPLMPRETPGELNKTTLLSGWEVVVFM